MPGVFRSQLNIQRWRGAVPNVLVSGRTDASVGAMGANVVTAAAVAAAALNGKGNWNIGKTGYGIVKSLQHVNGSGTWEYDDDTIDVTISAVTIANAIIIPRFFGGSSGRAAEFTWEITTTTNVKFTIRGGIPASDTADLSFDVVEFESVTT